MESLLVHIDNKSQLEKVKAFLREMKLKFENVKENELPISKNIPNAETAKAIEEGRKERHQLQSFSNVKDLMTSLENE